MAKVECPDCSTRMKKGVFMMARTFIYTCPKCAKQVIVAEQAYKSPSQQKMQAIKSKRLADRWANKIGE